ncbi:MAG: hypothetical protein ABL903_19470 [Methylococcales bacterium]
MKNTKFKKILLATGILLSSGFISNAMAHSGNGPLGPDASATDLATVECFDDGNGPGDHLVIQIEDLSPPVPGLMVNMQAFKGNVMTNITDTVSMDGNPSAIGTLKAGNGVYYISVNKTDAGPRTFNVTWHCETSTNVHTGSELNVLQVQ